jgi:hypothetical protein
VFATAININPAKIEQKTRMVRKTREDALLRESLEYIECNGPHVNGKWCF